MNADIFAEWLRRQGHHIVRTSSSYWHNQGPRIYQAFPYHWRIEPTEDELRRLLQEQKAVGLRYSTSCAASIGQVSYHVVYEGNDYRLEDLSKKARYDVRKGLDGVQVEPISFSQLATEGWQLRLDTLDRQGRLGAESQAWWQQLCAAARELPGFEAWGVLVENQLAASLLTFTCDDCCLILYQQSKTDFLSQGVNNALTYTVTHEVVSRPDVKTVFYGLHSLDAPDSVDKYKFRMRYAAAPVRQRVLFNHWFAPFLNRGSYAIVKQVAQRWPSQPQLAKAEGMIRFYLEGQKALTAQNWPEALLEQRDAILNQSPMVD